MKPGTLTRRKSLTDLISEGEAEVGLKRTLGPINLVAIGVGGIIGAGIFVLTGQAAANYAGPGIIISFCLAAIACAFAGLCYAEFASMIPIAGSAYTYSYATMGEFFAWFIGWDLILEYGVCAGTVAVGWSGYFCSFLRTLGIHIPPEVMASPGTEFVYLTSSVLQQIKLTVPEGWYGLANYGKDLVQAGIPLDTLQHGTALFNLPAALIVLALTALLVRGIEESATFNAIIVAIKVTIVLIVIGLGFAYVKTDKWFPLVPPNTRVLVVDCGSAPTMFGMLAQLFVPAAQVPEPPWPVGAQYTPGAPGTRPITSSNVVPIRSSSQLKRPPPNEMFVNVAGSK